MLEVGAFAEREKNLADIVLQVIVNSNMEKVREWKGSERIMCEALRVLMADELNEERMEGQREGRIEGQREGRIEGQREGRIERPARKARFVHMHLWCRMGSSPWKRVQKKRECLSEISQRK